jgi:hypothetical protein
LRRPERKVSVLTGRRGLRGSRWSRAPTSANMRLPRRRFAPCHRRLGLSVSSARRWTALRRASPGSRAVGKH